MDRSPLCEASWLGARLGLVAFLSLGGCGQADWATAPPMATEAARAGFDARAYRDHVVLLDSDGDPRSIETRDGQPPGGVDLGTYVRQRFVAMVDAATEHHRQRGQPDQPLRLLFYMHGGLNDEAEVHKSAVESWRPMEESGYFPVFLVWPTGFWSAYGEQVAEVSNGDRQDRSYAGAAGEMLGDTLGGLGGAPTAWRDSFRGFFETGYGLGSDSHSMAIDQEWVAAPDPLAAGRRLVTAERNVLFTLAPAEGGKLVVDQVRRDRQGPRAAPAFAYSVLTSPARAVTTPFTIGFGETAWDNMVRRSRTAVHAASEFEFEGPASSPTWAETRAAKIARLRAWPRGTGGFARLFHLLLACAADRAPPAPATGCPEGVGADHRKLLREARITLIGHSMGAIVANELLTAFPELPYERLIYMAAAASVRQTVDAVAPVLSRNQGCTKFFGLMLHPMNEAREASFFGLVPSGSLLQWVDSLYEHPKTVPDRTVGQWVNVRRTRELFPPSARHWMLWRVFARAEETGRPIPLTHGGFNDVERGIRFWEPQFLGADQVRFDREPSPAFCAARLAGNLAAAFAGGVGAPPMPGEAPFELPARRG
jgi:pimeloyl-ACP methyl ester carboxylesterase